MKAKETTKIIEMHCTEDVCVFHDHFIDDFNHNVEWQICGLCRHMVKRE